MTKEEIMNLGFEELESRKSAIAEETKEADNEQLEALNAELDLIEERRIVLANEAEESRKAADAVAKGAGKAIETRKEDKAMTNMEVRNTPEYIEAFAKYVKTGKDAECRALLTENVEDGTVPVPELVENRVRTAWENDEIFRRIEKTFVRGNLKVGFEVSATDAEIHIEGTDAPKEETLVLGIVTMVPQTIKKWITFSDEVMAMRAEEFLDYIYDELTYKVIKKAAAVVIEKILDAPAESTDTQVGVPTIDAEPSTAAIIDALAKLSDEARDLVFIADGATIAGIKKTALQAQYAYDPFAGVTPIQHTGMTGAIVGDLAGVQANLPEGEDVRFKFDDSTLAEKDLIKVVGKLYAAIEVVGPGMLCKIGTAESE